jgi:membrane anchored protein
MGIVNRRNATIGWLVVKLGKRAARRKAQGVAPTARTGGAVAGALAALGGLLVLKRKKRTDTE